ncbi:ESPR-type extended signal peptide-containing protein, partial [Kingella potus]
MNKIYRTVYNESTNTWTAVAEIAKAHGKSGRSSSSVVGALGFSGSRFAVSAMASAVMMTGAGQTFASAGIYVNDGTDTACAAIWDGNNRTNVYAVVPGAGVYNPDASQSHFPQLPDFQPGGMNPCLSTGTAGANQKAEAKDTQTNRALFYGESTPSGIGNNGATNLSLGGRLDVNSGIIGLGDRGVNGANATNSIRIGTGTTLDNANKKTNALAIGVDVQAAAEHAVAIGSNAKVNPTAPLTTQNTKGVSDASIAIGQTAYAEGLAAVAVGAKTKAIEHAVAIGTETRAEGLSAVAIGSNSKATTTNSVAMGTNSVASGANATALGQATKALGQSTVAVGDGANATDKGWGTAVGNSSTAAYGASAYGHLAKAAGDFGSAFGDSSSASGNNSVAIGKSAAAKADAVIALGLNAGKTSDETTSNTNTRAIMIGSSSGTGAQNINDSILMGLNAGKNLGVATKTGSHNIGLGASALADASGSTNVALATQAGMGASGNNNFFGQVNAGSYVTGSNNVAIGKNALKGAPAAKIAVSDAVVLGTEATADKDKAVALGAGASTATEAKQINTATVGTTTYGGFAGKVGASGYQVSVGAKDAERQIKHVAPGEISATSTDAINGSQLYSVADGLQTQIANISASGGGVHFYHVNGKDTDNNYNNNGATGTKAMAAGINAQAKGASSIAIGNATVEAESTFSGVGTSKTASQGAIAIGDTSYAAGSHALALGQARAEQKDSIALGTNARATAESSTAIGYNAVSSRQNGISIGNGANTAGLNSIAIGGSSATSASGSIALGYGAQATRETINATNVKAVSDAAVSRDQVYALDAASQLDKNNIAATVKGSSGALSIGTQQDTRQIINVAAGTEDSDAVNVAQLKSVANLVRNTTPTKVTPASGSKITAKNIGTVAAPNYEVDLTQDAKTSLGKADTAMQNFKVATVPNKGGTLTAGESVADGDTLTFEAGDNVSINQNGKKITINATGTGGGASKVEAAAGSPVTVGGTGTASDPYKVGVNTVALSNSPTGKVNAPIPADAGKLVTAGEIAKAINGSGFTLKTSAVGGEGEKDAASTPSEIINPGEAVEMIAGKNLKVKQSADGKVIYSTKDAVQFNTVTVGPISIDQANGINAGGKKIANVKAGENDDEAVNLKQLKNNGFNLAVAHSGSGTSADNTPSTATGAADKRIIGDETLILEAGSGINVSQNGGKITITNTGTGGGGATTRYYSVNSGQTAPGSNYANDGAAGKDSLAIGVKAKAVSDNSVAIGSDVTAEGTESLALGNNVITKGTGTTAVGNNTRAMKEGAQAFGQSSVAEGKNSAAVGRYATAKADRASAFGVGNIAAGESSFAGGDQSEANAKDAIAIGTKAKALNEKSVAIGAGANADKDNAVALGAGSLTDSGATKVVDATVNGIKYGGFAGSSTVAAGDQVSVGKVGEERQIKHVAPGEITATSTDAINGSQLYSVANEIGKGFSIKANADAAGVSAADKAIKPGSTLAVEGTGTGAFATDYSTGNIQTQVSSKGTVQIGLKNNLAVTSVTATDSKGNKTVTNGDGVTITPVAAGKSPVSLTSGGLNNGGNTVKGVASALNLYPAGTPRTGLLDLSNLTPDQKASAATAGDLANMGWVVSSDKTTGNLTKTFNGQVKNAGEVEFVGTGAAEVS